MSFHVLKTVVVKPEGSIPTANDTDELPPCAFDTAEECDQALPGLIKEHLNSAADIWNAGDRDRAIRMTKAAVGDSLEVLGNFVRFAAEPPEKAKHLLGIDKK